MQTLSDTPSIEGPAAGIGHNKASTTDILRDQFKDLMDEVEALAKRATDEKDKLANGAVETDEQRDALVSIGVDAGKVVRKLGPVRLETTKPLRDQVDETNKFFEAMSSRMERVKSAFERLVGAYDSAKREAAQREAAKQAELAADEAKRKLEEAAASTHSVEGDVILREAEKSEHRAQSLAREALGAGTGPTRTEAGTISQKTEWTFRIVDASKIDLNALRPHFKIAEIEKAIRGHIRANRDTVKLFGVEIFPDTKTHFRG